MNAAQKSLVRLRPTGATGWVESLRDEALANFIEQGIPTRRLEEWKGTNFAPLGVMDFTRVGGAAHALGEVASQTTTSTTTAAHELVFRDGRFDAAASRRSNLPDGVRALSLAEVLETEPELVEGRLGLLADLKRQSLVALQTAFLEDGAVIVLDPGTQLSQPLRLRFVSTADNTTETTETTKTTKTTETTEASEVSGAIHGTSAAFPRLLVLAGEGSSATLLQEHLTAGVAPGFTAFVAEFFLAEGARIENVQMQSEGAERIHFSSVHVRLDRDARFDSHVFSIGNGLSRSELEVRLAEPGAETNLRGLFIGRDRGHTDHFTTVDHAAPECTSDEEYRGVLGDHAKGVFRGRVIIRPGAQKSDTRQSNPNLLLSDHASIDTKPQLEIYADDIRASHGSTIGQLDSDALFYLQTRGIGAADARLLLTSAFAHGIVDRIVDEDLRRIVARGVDTALRGLETSASAAKGSRW